MAAVSKSESLLYKDARTYCARRHMNTLWKSMRVDRRYNTLLDKQLHLLEKSRSFRARQLDQEQELFLEGFTTLFERQCEIAADKLELQIGDHMVQKQLDSAQARLKGSRQKSIRRLRSFTVPIENVLTDSEIHVVPGCEHERPPAQQTTLGETFRVSSAFDFGKHSRNQFKRGFQEYVDGRSSACCGNEHDEKGMRTRPEVTEDQRTQQAPSRLSIHESVSLEPLRCSSSRKKSGISRPGTAASGRQSVGWKQVPHSRPGTNTIMAATAPVRQPAWSSSKEQNLPNTKGLGYKSFSGKQERCNKCEPTIAWEIVPKNGRKHNRKVPTASSTLQSTVFQPGHRGKTTAEETLFRKQFLTCAMSRFLPISALRGPSFGEHDDVRKKMEGRRRCLDELKNRSRIKIQSVPDPISTGRVSTVDISMPISGMASSKLSHEGVTTRASSSYIQTPITEISKDETSEIGHLLKLQCTK